MDRCSCVYFSCEKYRFQCAGVLVEEVGTFFSCCILLSFTYIFWMLKEVWFSIESANCVHPLLMLEILSHSEILRVAHVKNYIIKWLQKHDEQVKQCWVDEYLNLFKRLFLLCLRQICDNAKKIPACSYCDLKTYISTVWQYFESSREQTIKIKN